MIPGQQPEQAAPFTAETAMQSTQQSGNVYAEQKLREAALMQKEQQLAGAEQQLAMASQQMAAEKQGMDNVLAALAQGGAGGLGMAPAQQGLGDASGMNMGPEQEAMEASAAIEQGANPDQVLAQMSPEAIAYMQQLIG